MEAFIVEVISPMGERLRLHQIDKRLQVLFRGGDIVRCDAVLGTHPLHGVGDPRLQKQLTGRIDPQRIGRLKNGYPELIVQCRSGHNQGVFL